MNNMLHDCIKAIYSHDTHGFSYVRSFVKTLWEHRDTLNISSCAIVWNVYFNNESYKQLFIDYIDSNAKSIIGLDIMSLFLLHNAISSEDESFNRYIRLDVIKRNYYIAIPINGNSNDEGFFKTYGLILLSSSNGKILIEKSELDIFHLILNQMVPHVLCEDLSIDALVDIAKSETRNHYVYSNCFADIGQSLDTIAGKFSQNNNDCGLRHFSLWRYFQAEENIKIKQFSRNTYHEEAHNNTHIYLIDDDVHFLNDAFNDYDPAKDVQILRCFGYKEVRESFADEDYFRSIGLKEENTTVIVSSTNNINEQSPDRLLNFYVANIIYTPFISKLFVEGLTRSISNDINKCLVTCRDKILCDLMYSSIISSNETDFYAKAKKLILDVNEAEDVIIYIDENGFYKSMTHQTDNNNMDGHFKLPEKYSSDLAFSEWATKTVINHTTSFYINVDNDNIKTSMIIRTRNNEWKDCIIIAINKRHNPSNSCVYFNNVFDNDNYFLTDHCGHFLIQYQKMQDSINNKNYLLHKLRHEIPSCTEAIEQCVSDIKNALSGINVSRANIDNIASNIELHNSRVLLLAKFFSTVDFDSQQFAADKQKLNLRTFLASCIETFRTEGKYRGVDVYYYMCEERDVIIQVSSFFQLAIVNIITNAVRYSSPGTCVIINVYNDRIEICDIGICITEKDKSFIFREGYRGANAKRISEKGMGYGLYLTKKVLDAHNMKIRVESTKYGNKNYFAEHAVMIYLNTLGDKDRKEFIYRDLDELNKHVADHLYSELKRDADSVWANDRYGVLKIDTIKSWLKYLKENNVVFLDMSEDFEEEIYEVIFTIQL